MNLTNIYKSLRTASSVLSTMNGFQKNAALASVRDVIKANHGSILKANKIDIDEATKVGTSAPLIDRLKITDERLKSIEESITKIIDLADPVGQVTSGWTTPGGLNIRQVRVPIGVVAVIYESRPNVTVDTFALCFKSGNAVLLRGSHSAYNTNRAIVSVIKDALNNFEINKNSNSDTILLNKKDSVNATKSPNHQVSYDSQIANSLELVDVSNGTHDDINEILSAVDYIDVALPRGSKRLIDTVKNIAKVPIIETGSGVCHLFIDESADISMATNIAENAKIQRPGVCNAVECILVHKNILNEFLPALVKKFAGRVIFHADDKSYKIIEQNVSNTLPPTKLLHATTNDEGHEYLDYECYIKCIDNIDDAITYINSHNTRHSESIITQDFFNAKKFQSQIDASCVYVNASTRFTDGGEFGFGAELGISTQKLHARGPMGLTALTTTKYLIDGDGQIRK